MASPLKFGPTPSKAGIGCLIIFALFWSGITLTVDAIIGWNAIRQIRATSYATTPGVITRSEIESQQGKHGPTQAAKISFSYQVGGRKLSGDQYRYGAVSSNDSNAAKVVAAFPPGKQVTVYYSPADPTDAVLVPGLEGADLFIAMFMTPFNFIMLGMWIAAGSAVFRRGSRPVAGGAKIRDDGFRIQVRLAQFTPLGAALGFVFFASFLGLFPIGFTAGFNPPLRVMQFAWFVIVFGAVVVFVWRSMKLASGYTDLVIDPTERSVTLPRTFGRTDDVVVPLKRIQAVEVERIAKKGAKRSTNYEFVPTLVYAERDDTVTRAKLAQWSNGAAAEELAAWLREKLQLKPTGAVSA
jgi:hypothetical protein